MKKSALPTALLLLVCTCAPAKGQSTNPLSDGTRMGFSTLKTWVMTSVEKMPEAHFGFRPASDVRTFGQIVGHIADVHYRFCSVALGEKNPLPNVEKTKTTRADLTAELSKAFAYCDRAYNALTDANAAEMLKFGPGMPRLSVLTFNSMHTTLHYGNLVTYMRIKNVTPPSSEPPFVPAAPKS